MNKILILNCGSSSVKAALYDQEQNLLHSGAIRNLHTHNPSFIWDGKSLSCPQKLTVETALEMIFNQLKEKIDCIGHRFVHGADQFQKTTRLTPEVIRYLEELNALAPLHNPACLTGIKKAMEKYNTPQYAVFDTSFYRDLPQNARIYALPPALCSKHSIRRYGFHGISHEYLWKRYCAYTQTKDHKILTLHLGNGCSITATDKGKPIDTSMGFSPAEGLVMGTRSGDIDPTLIAYLADVEKISLDEATHIINFESGLKGLSELSEDMKVLEKNYSKNEKVKAAIDLFCYRAAKYIAAYLMILEGAHALIFSGGIGENSTLIRNLICQKLRWLGISIHEDHMSPQTKEPLKISQTISSIPVYIIPTNENLQIFDEITEAFLR